MPKICYVPKKFSAERLKLIDIINQVIQEYQNQGYSLTLRQTYYQLVARNIIPNSERSYKNIGNLINDARLAGYIDWTAIEDRTRNVRGISHFDSPQDLISVARNQYRRDMWLHQNYHLEVWVEKEALSDVVRQACTPYDVNYFSCRGYVSQSEMWSASSRLMNHRNSGKHNVIIYLGDHDPSGIDMSRDIKDRLTIFGVGSTDVRRIALNMDQIEEFNPPPNPAKVTDSRYEKYTEEYGDESWELDSLEPAVLHKLIQGTITEYINHAEWERVTDLVATEKKTLEEIEYNWSNIEEEYRNRE